MNHPTDFWQRLIAAARRAPADEGDLAMPLGFATRVVGLAFAAEAERPLFGLFERFSWRALGVALALAAVSAAANLAPALQALRAQPSIEQDPVALVLDLTR